MPSELPRLETIFNDAMEIAAPDERAAFLDRACGDDAELRRRVDALLAAHDNTGDVLRLPRSQRTLEAVAALSEGPGMMVGRYRLLEQIGEGGFGVVFMAEQQQPVRRKVALKLLKPGMDSRQVLARFEAERQALALMDHPNIAKVLDAGATDAGRPYFVMELVKGVPITEFCDQHQLTARQRLELFAHLCHAVQHAHQKGIIHRDIKPTNVLVMMHDTTPMVKVIDFGVAKALGQELTEKTLFTGFAQHVGTPLYMSPEQAGQSALDADTRSDIYSLGVLLYELLTGSTPFDKERFKKAAQEEIRRIIREEEPPKPSTRLSESKDSLASICAQRHTEPAKLTRLVRGELDWIVMKALEKDRGRRYETANAFAHDIERFLNDEIVLARPPSGLYRFRKLVRRNRLIFAASAAVGAALLLGAILSTALAIRLKRTADAVRAEQSRTAVALAETRRQKEAAEAASAEANAVNAFLTRDIIGAANPEVQRGRKLTVEEAVEKAAARVSETFKDRPLIEASIRDALAQTLLALGRTDQAAVHARTALDLRRRLLGDDDARTLNSLVRMGAVLKVQGKLSEAELLLREALARGRRVLGDDHPVTLKSIDKMGELLVEQGKRAEAEPLYREALERNRRLLGNDHRETINSLGALANLLVAQGKLAEAEPLAREALERTRRVLGNDEPFALAIGDMGGLYRQQGKRSEAEPLYREALERERRLLGDDHPNTLKSISNLGHLLDEEGKYSEAEPLLREGLERRRRVLGDDHPRTLISIGNLGYLLLARRNLSEAEPLLREGLERNRRVLGNDHVNTIISISEMGELLEAQEKRSEAEPLYREALERRRRVLGDDHPHTIYSIDRMGRLLVAQGKRSEAEQLYRETLERNRRLLGSDHWATINSLSALAELLAAQDKFAEAEPLQREALERSRRVHGDDRPATIISINRMGALFRAQDKLAEAEPLYREGLERSRRVLGNNHPFTINARKDLGGLLKAQGKLAEAELLLREALEQSRRVLGNTHPITINARKDLGGLLKARGKLAEADALLGRPVERLRALAAGSPENLESAIKQAMELKLEGLSPLDLLTCCEYFVLAGENQKAVEAIQRAIVFEGSRPFYQKALGWALLRGGEAEKAHKALSAALAEKPPTRRAATTQSATSGPATRPPVEVDRWTAAYLLGAVSQDEYVKLFEANYPSLVWFYIGEKLDISGDRPGALAAYRKSASQTQHHRTANWSAYRIKQITGKYERATTAPTAAAQPR